MSRNKVPAIDRSYRHLNKKMTDEPIQELETIEEEGRFKKVIRSIASFFKRFAFWKKKPQAPSQNQQRAEQAKKKEDEVRPGWRIPKGRLAFRNNRRRRYNNTPLNPINRHGELGFAIRQANKLNRRPKALTAYRLPQFLKA